MMPNKTIFDLMPKITDEERLREKRECSQKALKLIEMLDKTPKYTKQQEGLMQNLLNYLLNSNTFGFETWAENNSKSNALCKKLMNSEVYYFSGRTPEEEDSMDFVEIVQFTLKPTELAKLLRDCLDSGDCK